MDEFGTARGRDGVLLLARVLLVVLFVVFGWGKLLNPAGTAAYFAHDGLPAPVLATAIAIVMELVVGCAIAAGVLTRPLALLLAVYTLATALIGHPYWSFAGPARMAAEINFYKNVSIIGGLLALYAAGPGRFSVDARRRPAAARV